MPQTSENTITWLRQEVEFNLAEENVSKQRHQIRFRGFSLIEENVFQKKEFLG